MLEFKLVIYMNNQYIILSGIVVFFVFYTYALVKLRNRRICKEYILKYLRNGHPFPIEIIKGSYEVVEKYSGDRLDLVRVEKGRKIGSTLYVVVPIRMFDRLTLGRVYYFCYDYKEHLICFHNESRHTERSYMSEDNMKKELFPLKTHFLERLNR